MRHTILMFRRYQEACKHVAPYNKVLRNSPSAGLMNEQKYQSIQICSNHFMWHTNGTKCRRFATKFSWRNENLISLPLPIPKVASNSLPIYLIPWNIVSRLEIPTWTWQIALTTENQNSSDKSLNHFLYEKKIAIRRCRRGYLSTFSLKTQDSCWEVTSKLSENNRIELLRQRKLSSSQCGTYEKSNFFAFLVFPRLLYRTSTLLEFL